MLHPSPLALARLWLAGHLTEFGLVWAMVLLTAIFVLGSFPLGPIGHVDGVVESVAMRVTRSGVVDYARVRIDGRLRSVRSLDPYHCRVGSRIHPLRQRRLLGVFISGDGRGCDARPW